jgi:penicillin amidase
MDESRDIPPIEFDLLNYLPEPWAPADCLAIMGEFRWYLTGRFPVIAAPEMVKRALGDGPLYRDFIVGEFDDESILHRGEYTAGPATVSSSTTGGSNNWVLAGSRTKTGKPLVASDPHVPFAAVSLWHEIVLNGGTFRVAGVAYAGMPAVMIGRNERVAWGVTNNICSLRDLYQEKTDPNHPNCFLFDGRWEPAREREEVIAVRGQSPVRKIVRSSRNGPIVDAILPPPVRDTGPVSLRWVGMERCGWLTAMIGMNRARSCAEFREAGQSWAVPTFNLVFADTDGHIGFQTVGRIPIRRIPERGYRPGWDPNQQWDGYVPYDSLPRLIDPPRGYTVTANNRVAADDFPYPLSGTWSSGHRARRIREAIEAQPKWTADDCRRLQLDVYSHRAAAAVPHVVAAVDGDADSHIRAAVQLLKAWDYRVTAESAAAAVFNVFFARWCKTVAQERLPAAIAAFATALAGGIAARLLIEDRHGWFQTDRRAAIRGSFIAALDELATKLGPDMSTWSWGRIHPLVQKHFLSGRGDLGLLLDRSGLPCPGDGTTVCSGTPDASHAAWLGASYRMVADLSETGARLRAVDVAGASGHPGSPHYDDQLQPWVDGNLHDVGQASCLPRS